MLRRWKTWCLMAGMNTAATELINRLGGSTAVANRLGWRSLNGSRRVNNWKRRGIPPSVQLQNEWLRLAPSSIQAQEEAHG